MVLLWSLCLLVSAFLAAEAAEVAMEVAALQADRANPYDSCPTLNVSARRELFCQPALTIALAFTNIYLFVPMLLLTCFNTWQFTKGGHIWHEAEIMRHTYAEHRRRVTIAKLASYVTIAVVSTL